ncbi:MAG TPA: type II secretion system F family protein [Actinomycetota bacterium]|nr:type II secretion system F family protein [Actinomycetota bacterium]
MNDLVISVLAGLAAVGLPASWSVVRRDKKSSRLLQRLQANEVARQRRTPGGPLLEGPARRLASTRLGRRLESHAATAHPGVPFSDVVAIGLLAWLSGLLLGTLLLGGGIASMTAATLAPVVVDRFFVRLHGNRAARIEKQLPEALHLQGSVLRAGQSLGRSLEVLATETKPPLRDDLQRMLDEVDFGRPMGEALERFSSRIRSRDVDMWVTAMLVHRQTGGNLAGVVDSTARRVALRLQLRSEVKAMTAQGRLSGMVVGVAPLAFFILLSASSGEQLKFLFTTPLGLTILGTGLGMNILGMVWIKHALRVRS